MAALVLFFVCVYFLEKFLLTKGKQLFEIVKSASKTIIRDISAKPGVQQFVSNHPAFAGILQNRLNTRKFSGLPLSLMVIAFLYVLLALMGVIEDIIGQETIVAFDSRFENLLYVYRSPILVKIFLWITLLGKIKIIFSLGLVFSLLLWIWSKRDYILPLWISLSGSYIFFFFGKIALHRKDLPVSASMIKLFLFPVDMRPLQLSSMALLPTFSYGRSAHGEAGSTCPLRPLC
jgi:undecaprenyl-diphosphatase